MILFYLLVSIMPMIRHPFWSDFLGDFTFIKYLGLVCLLYALYRLAARPTALRILARPQLRWFLAIAALGMISFRLFGPDMSLELSPFMNYLSFVGLMFITVVVVDSQQRLRWTILTAIGSIAYASAVLLREWQKEGMVSGYRPGWVTGDPNYFSVSAVLILPIVFYLMQSGRPTWERWFCGGALVLSLFAVTLAASRGALVAVVASMLLVVLRSARPVRLLLIGAALIVPMLLLAPTTPLERLLWPTYSDVEAADNRTRIWELGLMMIRHHPVTGVGAGNFKPIVSQYVDPRNATIAHNTYIGVTAELGVPGLLLYAGLFVATFRSLSRVRRLVPQRGHLLHLIALGIEAGLVAFLIAVFFISAEYQKFFWLLIFVSAALESLASAEASAQAVPARPPRPMRTARPA